MNIYWFGGLGNNSVEFFGCNELSFTLVPCGKDLFDDNLEFLESESILKTNLCRWSTAQDSRMDQTREFNVWNVTRSTINAFKVPDGFGSVGTQYQSHDPMMLQRDVRCGVYLI
jgi:hypothetical protein